MELFEITDDDDQEIVDFLNHQRRVYTIRMKIDHMAHWDDQDFRMKFRMSKNVVVQVLKFINDQISSQSDGNHAVASIDKLLLTLRLYATGNFLITAADFFGVSKTTALTIVCDVSIAIAKLRPKFIKMPNSDQEITALKKSFHQIAKFPRTIGAIGCTHVKIQNQGGPTAECFKNQKGYFSLKVQTVSCPKLKVMDVVARWPGSCHDYTILKKSVFYTKLNSNQWGNSLIVAGNDYANSQYIVTPFINPQNDTEELYNESIIKTRNTVERSHDVLKRRFPILSFGSQLTLQTTQAVIVACCVLHNIACDNNDLDPPISQDMVLPENENMDLVRDHIDEDNTRQKLIENYFSCL